MTKREFLKSEVLKTLSLKLLPFGFKLVKSDSVFVQKTELGWNKYRAIFLLRDEGWEVKPDLLVRFDVVEDIFHQISDFEKKYQKGTPTIGAAIEDLEQKMGSRFSLLEENQIEMVADELFVLFKSIALPFFERFNNLEALDNSLNMDPEDTALTGGVFKGTKSLIIAHLLKRNDFDKLKDIYQKYYEGFADGFYLPEYIRLKEIINKA